MTFLKRDFALGIFSYYSFSLTLVGLWGIFSLLGEDKKKRFWAIFMFSSLAGVISQIASTQTDLMVGALIISSIYLFLSAEKNSDKTLIFFSSLAYALAMGVKTPAGVIFPAVLIFFLLFKNKKNVLWFMAFTALNFLVFSSYNYILNFLDFSNPLGSPTALVTHKFWGGIQAFLANLIRYAYLFIDFSGFKWELYIFDELNISKEALFSLLNIDPQIGVIIKEDTTPNVNLSEQIMGFGVLGFLVFIPCVLISILNIRKNRALAAFGILFLLCTLCLALTVGFMPYNIRFFTTFIAISSPVLVYSYFGGKNLYKIIVAVFAMYYMGLVATHLAQRPFFKILNTYKNNSYENFREKIYCQNAKFLDGKSDVCYLIDYFKPLSKSNPMEVGFFANSGFDMLYFKEFLESNGHKLTVLLAEEFDNYDLSKYHIIITPNVCQITNNIKYFPQKLSEYTYVKGKTVLLKTEGVPCMYINKSGNVIFNPKQTPFGIRCFVEPKHLKDFIPIKTLESVKNKDKYINSGLVIYMNKNLFKR